MDWSMEIRQRNEELEELLVVNSRPSLLPGSRKKQKNMERAQALVDAFVVNPADPPMALTHRGNHLEARQDPPLPLPLPGDPVAYHPSPYLIVPWLGISRPYVLDLMPGASMIEYLVDHGHDVYLLDWGEIAEEDKELGFEEAVFKILPRAIDRALETSGATELTLNGLCLGGTISAAYLALNPDAPVRNFVAVVAPINFEEGGLFRTWLNDPHFPAELIVQRYNGLPASLMNTGFKMLRPTLEAQALSGLWANINRPGYVGRLQGHEPLGQRLHRNARPFLPAAFPGYVRQEQPDKRRTRAQRAQGGPELASSSSRCWWWPPTRTFIVPAPCARSLMDAVSSEDKEYVELPGGHISVFSGRQAHQTLWPKIDEWVATPDRSLEVPIPFEGGG